MIVCKNCGHQNEDNDTFCGSCGKFLEWTGERVAVAEPEPEPAPLPPPPAPEPTHVGLIDRVKHAVGIEETEQGTPRPAAAPPAATAPPPVAPAPVASTPPPAPAPRPVPIMSSAPPPPAVSPPTQPVAAPPAPRMAAAPPAPMASPTADPIAAREPVLAGVGAPVATPSIAATPRDDEPMSRRPTSVAPTVARPRQAARTLEAPTRRRPGDLICGQCGEGNDPTRHFCRRCGNTLDEALAVQLPWYRRFWNRLFGSRTYQAGYRHRRVGPPNVMGGVMRIVRLAIVALILVALLAFALVPSFHNLVVNRVTTGVTAVRKIIRPRYDPIHPTGASASTSTAGHLPGLAVDGFNNTYWAALKGDPNPDLKLTFAGPTDLAEIGITSGASGSAPADQYLAQPRPKAVHLVFSDGTAVDLNVADQAAVQFFPLNVKQVTFVEIHILSVWPTAGPAPSSVAITEVEFKVKD